jgi:PilZ domain
MICSMDRRLHHRALTDLDVEVVRIKNKDQRVAGRLEDISESGMCVILPCELEPEELVRLEAADCTLYGHVVYSTWKRNAFRTGVEVERVLLSNTDLAELLRTVLQDTMPWAALSPR